MYLVAGNNIFGQWFSAEKIIKKFKTLSTDDTNFHLTDAKLVAINWSYNIFEVENKFYVTGTWGGKDNQIIKIPLPDDISSDSIITGNDYNLILINNEHLCIFDLETNSIKKSNINIETPLNPDNDSKKLRLDVRIVKIICTNETCLFLTVEGLVYMGFLPTLLDTSHCEGKICDIQCGFEHYVILTDAGRIYTWGNGWRLQLGHGDLVSLESPTEVKALAGIKITKIRTGGWHTLALSEFGDLYAWGWNDSGQLGIKQQTNAKKENVNSYFLPTVVDLFDENDAEINLNVKDMDCGSKHSVIILEDDSVWCTGYNKYGQLGTSPNLYPVINNFKKIIDCESDSLLQCGPWTTVIKKNIL